MGQPVNDLAWQASTVLHRYCEAIDRHDADALRDVFSEDVVLLVAGDTGEGDEGGDAGRRSFAGRDTVVAILASLFEQRLWARHLVSNVLVDAADDGELAVRCSFQYLLAKADSRAIGVGDYRATMREVDGRLVMTRFSATVLDEVDVPRAAAVPA